MRDEGDAAGAGCGTGFLRGRVRSFACAGRGIRVLLSGQRNAWVHAAATAGVVAGGLACGVSGNEWCLLALAMGLVWAAEGLNTAVEALGDAVSAGPDARVGRAKDVAAGGVLLAAIAAAVVGAVVFGPRLADWWAGVEWFPQSRKAALTTDAIVAAASDGSSGIPVGDCREIPPISRESHRRLRSASVLRNLEVRFHALDCRYGDRRSQRRGRFHVWRKGFMISHL